METKANVLIFDRMIRLVIGWFFLAVYLPLTVGIGISSHFCDGKLKATKTFSLSKQSCCCGGAEQENTETDGCCKDEVKLVKLEKDHLNQSQNVDLKSSTSAHLAVTQHVLLFSARVKTQPIAVRLYSPPRHVYNRTISHCSFLI